jgi:pantetheine-phosphate adenylyltransferase
MSVFRSLARERVTVPVRFISDTEVQIATPILIDALGKSPSLHVTLEIPTLNSFLVVPVLSWVYQFTLDRNPDADVFVVPIAVPDKGSDAPFERVTLLPFTEPPGEVVCLGGTFDRLHPGHRVLLSAAAILSTKSLVIGINRQTSRKVHSDLLESFPVRCARVIELLYEVNPNLSILVEPLDDVAGPAGVLPKIDLLILSEETVKGGEMVNEIRAARGLQPVHYAAIPTITRSGGERLSSTFLREVDARRSPA